MAPGFPPGCREDTLVSARQSKLNWGRTYSGANLHPLRYAGPYLYPLHAAPSAFRWTCHGQGLEDSDTRCSRRKAQASTAAVPEEDHGQLRNRAKLSLRSPHTSCQESWGQRGPSTSITAFASCGHVSAWLSFSLSVRSITG